ncbi:pyridoxal-phosphate dependent enzyme [Nocardia sp. NPDC059246]|uniref:threonine synthase n=1 Tax=unclassified Nocardia TaxID=2637762 RepID=UPI0036CB4481
MTNAYTGTMGCPRCSSMVPDDYAIGGCRTCGSEAIPVNLHARFDTYDPIAAVDDRQPGIFRWRAGFPIEPRTIAISLHEGNTRAVRSDKLAEMLGVASVVAKDESRNPTSSYKDRLASVAVTRAVEVGARTVVVASTGNHGAAVAAYAAVAGLNCVVLAARSASPLMVEQMRSYGARVIALPTIPDRWAVMKTAVDELGWFPTSGFQNPPVGSPPFGIEGYKSIAFELHEQLARTPTMVIVPTAYGDGLTGVFRGFKELHAAGRIAALPRMVAAEALGAHVQALQNPGIDRVSEVGQRPTLAFSAGTSSGTYQALATLRLSAGYAVSPISDDAILHAQEILARETGMFVETTSAMSLAAALRLRDDGALRDTDDLVLVITSSGLKSTKETAAHRAPIPIIEPRLDDLVEALGDG